MRPSSLLWLILVALLGVRGAGAQSSPKQQSDTTYVITGRVINNVDQGPVIPCSLSVSAIVRDGFANRQFHNDLDSVACDEHGHFSVPVPSAGSWRLTASARGYITQAYEEHESFTTGIVLSAEKPTMDIVFGINPAGRIGGVVVDEAGEPVRAAQVTLQTVPMAGSSGMPSPVRTRTGARTDDRGMYEFANVAPGSYRVMLQAQPWYAAWQPQRQGSNTASLDPSLDFTYPLTWFPGVSSSALAETIELGAGEMREADFPLKPIPAAHIQIAMPADSNSAANGRQQVMFPMVQQIAPGSTGLPLMAGTMRGVAQGQMDVGGLAPGKYRVRIAGANGQESFNIVEVMPGSTRTLDLGTPSSNAKVTFQFDGIDDSESRSIQVNLIDTATGSGNFLSNFEGGSMGVRRGSRNSEHTMEVAPGQYEVVLQGRPDVYLAGITAKGADAAGRYVTLAAGAVTLTLHIARGRATVSGVARFQGKPSIGAMVLLVPITIEDANSLTILRREQTNTDGGFELDGVLPGKYILVAIDHGWRVNRNDPSTLRGYLMQGVPLELTAGAKIRQNIDAQAP